MFCIGEKVPAKATLFDSPGQNSWSKSIFGDHWNHHKIVLEVQESCGQVGP